MTRFHQVVWKWPEISALAIPPGKSVLESRNLDGEDRMQQALLPHSLAAGGIVSARRTRFG